jgi:cytochrome P450
MDSRLPPGPRMPATLQTLGVWSRPTAFLERARARYGSRFTLYLLGQVPFVMLSDPEEIKQLFQAPPDVVHPGEGARILEPIVGKHSVILLDEDSHLEQRRLMLPAFHGERMARLADLMSELAERELACWPREETIALHSRLQRLTLEIILRAVFGLEQGAQLDALREVLTAILAFSESPLSLLPMPRGLFARFGPVARFQQLMARADDLIFEVIAGRGGGTDEQDVDGDDVLAMLLDARHEDGSPMTPQELRDELMTALVAGHETTASQLAWAFERLAREPGVLRELYKELDGDAGEEEYLKAVVYEILRLKPVLPYAQVAVVKQPIEIGGVLYPPGVALVATAHLLHHDPAIYPEPHAFRPERFLGETPSTYTWIPFGGGRRRCLGASFAQLEMKLVLRTVLEHCELHRADGRAEVTRRRSITISPARGARVVLRDRVRARTPSAEERGQLVAVGQ